MPKDLPPSLPTTPASALLNSIMPSSTLGEVGQRLWDQIQREYAIEDVASVEVLSHACVVVDRAAELAAGITHDGAVIQTPSGPRPHPAIKAELAARTFVLKALRELGLTQQSIKPVGRPPSELPTMRGVNRNADRPSSARAAHPWGAEP